MIYLRSTPCNFSDIKIYKNNNYPTEIQVIYYSWTDVVVVVVCPQCERGMS